MKNVLKNITAATTLSVVLAFISGNALATGTSAAQFLKMGAGARATAMGEAFSSVADDATAGYWNPAGLAQLQTAEISAMQNTHFIDTQYQYLGAAIPAGRNTFGASVYRLDYGSIDGYSKDDVKQGSFGASSLAAAVSMARKINENLMLGATIKNVSETIDGSKASAFAADLGALYKWDRINFSGVVQHVGPAMKMVSESAPLPMTIRAGASTHVMNDRMLVAVEVSKPNDSNLTIHAGGEYKLASIVTVRGGYKTTPGQSANLGGLVGLNAGLGITFNRFNFDYAVSPFGDLGVSHRLSFGYKFASK